MKLTKKDRIILHNQFEIMKINNGDEKEYYEKCQDILAYGYTLNYGEMFGWMAEEEADEEMQQFVYAVLDMFRGLAFSFQELKNKADLTNADVRYQGFDGNNEGEYYAYANFLLEKLKVYQESYELSKSFLNSHCRKVDKYNRMLEVFNDYSLEIRYKLTVDQIKAVINA